MDILKSIDAVLKLIIKCSFWWVISIIMITASIAVMCVVVMILIACIEAFL